MSNAASRSAILEQYATSFLKKETKVRSQHLDVLLETFRLTPAVLRTNRQYWHRELGMCWEKLVKDLFSSLPGYAGAVCGPEGSPCDFIFGTTAVDTKYRLGSGDAGTLNKFVRNGLWLAEKGFTPVMLIVRDDSLSTARSRMRSCGWTVLEAQMAFDFIAASTGTDLHAELLVSAASGHFGRNRRIARASLSAL